MARVRFNKNFNVNRVVKRLVATVLALYVGGTIMTTFGTILNSTASPFYSGVSLIGWTVNNDMNGTTSSCGVANITPSEVGIIDNCITATSGSGVLAVVGIIAIAQIVIEFINW